MRTILLFLLSLLLLFSCFEGEEEDVLVIALAQEPPTLDVSSNSSISARMIASGNIFEKLLRLEDGEIKPELADSYSLSDDGRRLSLHIRAGVRFHDGQALSPQDVAASLNRWLDSYMPASILAGEGRFTFDMESFSVRIESGKSLALMPLMMASSSQAAVIMPERVLAPLVTEYVGTGPYKYSGWKSGAGVSLERYEGYWGPQAARERVDYLFVPDAVTRRLGLESGLYDVIDTVSNDDLPALAGKDGIALLQGEESGSIALVLNREEGVMRDRDCRQAVALLLDRENIMRACYGNEGYSLHSDYMEDSVWSVDPSLDPYGGKAPEEAEKLLGKLRDGKVRILTSNLSGLDRIAIALSSELGASGIESDVTMLDWVSFLEKRKDVSSWDVYVSAYTRTSLPAQKAYLSGYEELLGKVLESGSQEEAVQVWQEVQQALWEEVPVIIPGHYTTTYAAAEGIEGLKVRDGVYLR